MTRKSCVTVNFLFFLSLTLISGNFSRVEKWTTIVRKNYFYLFDLFKNTHISRIFLIPRKIRKKSNEDKILKDIQIEIT